MPKMSDITTAQLRYFVEAADRLSMTRAAETLMIAQSAVSSSISQLEKSLGIQLFVRKPAKGLVLTPAGQRFHDDAREILAHLDSAIDAAQGQAAEIKGTITLACFVTLVPFYVPGLLATMASLHPGLKVEIHETAAEGFLDALRSGRAQLGLGYPFGFGESIRSEEVAAVEPYVLLPQSHPLAHMPSVELKQLEGEPMILLDLPFSREYFLRLLHDAEIHPEVRYRSRNYETVRSLVAKGYGFSILNQIPASPITYGGEQVVAVTISDNVPPLPVVVAELAAVRSTARSRAVIAGIRSVVEGLSHGP